MTELASLPNPFVDTVVQDAWQSPPDVVAIHDQVFQACLSCLQSARRGYSDSVLVFGPAGSGKTHLLSRLQRHLQATRQDAPDRELQCVFVFVRLQTSPRLLWQHLRRRLANDLMRRDQGVTQVQRLVAHQLAASRGESPSQWVLALRVLSHHQEDEVSTYLAEVAQTVGLGRDVCIVLDHLVCNRFVQDAAAWLAGDSLPEAALARLGLGPSEAEDREDAARQTVTALCRLAGATLPIVFCFDQVEALQQSPADREGFFRFGRLAADLHDADDNVVLITCVQSALLELFEDSVREADRHRVFRRRAILEPLTRAQVEELVGMRLDSLPELVALRGEQSGSRLFPFDGQWIDELIRVPPSTPRHVLSRCSERFDALQKGRVVPRPALPVFLGEELAERRRGASCLKDPADVERILLHGLAAHAEIRGTAVPGKSEVTSGVDWVLSAEPAELLSVRNETNMTSLARRLRHLLELPKEKLSHLVLVRDPRLAVSRSAKKTLEYLQDLSQRGVRLVRPHVEALAALEALSSLLSDAKSGDLANAGDPVAPGTVLSWLRGLTEDSVLEAADSLVSEFSGTASSPAPSSDALLEELGALLALERMVLLEELAQRLERPRAAIHDLARNHPGRFGILEGPPGLVFDLAGITAEEGSHDH